MKKNITVFGLVLAVAFSSCEIDNYAEPDGHITGTLIDAITGQPYITEQPNGFRVNCRWAAWSGDETSASQSFWGKADGTYNNDKIFAGTLIVGVGNGSFHNIPSDTLEVRSKKTTVHDFTVTPYVSFYDVSIVKDPNTAGGAVITFTLRTNPLYAADTVQSAATIRDYSIFATQRSSKVGINVFDSDVSVINTRLTEADLGKPIVVRKSGFKSGATYYIRVGARCNESTDARHNMTEIVKLEF
jgi:hypothetical protein